MPLVFVHGVNNRDGDDYRDTEAGRNGFLREIVAPALGLAPDALCIVSPYWGQYGVKFAWNMAVLPDPSVKYEAFGTKKTPEAHVADLVSESDISDGVVQSAQRNFAGTVDTVYAVALAGASTEDDARMIARSYKQAATYVADNESPAWLANVSDANFAGQLNHYASAQTTEKFGGVKLTQKLDEAVSRIGNALPAATTQLGNRLVRKNLNGNFTRFIGDVFVYLANRQTPQGPGAIVKVVIDGLREAKGHMTPDDNKLVVIAHSFGGEIMYDILTHFAPDIELDVLITVGSQVGLFEEMKAYPASDVTRGATNGKVPRPPNVKRWLNVFDTNDVLSYQTDPVFDGTHDFLYNTGFSTLQAHSGYFLRPSFYERLAKRIGQP